MPYDRKAAFKRQGQMHPGAPGAPMPMNPMPPPRNPMGGGFLSGTLGAAARPMSPPMPPALGIGNMPQNPAMRMPMEGAIAGGAGMLPQPINKPIPTMKPMGLGGFGGLY